MNDTKDEVPEPDWIDQLNDDKGNVQPLPYWLEQLNKVRKQQLIDISDNEDLPRSTMHGDEWVSVEHLRAYLVKQGFRVMEITGCPDKPETDTNGLSG